MSASIRPGRCPAAARFASVDDAPRAASALSAKLHRPLALLDSGTDGAHRLRLAAAALARSGGAPASELGKAPAAWRGLADELPRGSNGLVSAWVGATAIVTRDHGSLAVRALVDRELVFDRERGITPNGTVWQPLAWKQA